MLWCVYYQQVVGLKLWIRRIPQKKSHKRSTGGLLWPINIPIKNRSSVAGALWQTAAGIREHGRIILAWSFNRYWKLDLQRIFEFYGADFKLCIVIHVFKWLKDRKSQVFYSGQCFHDHQIICFKYFFIYIFIRMFICLCNSKILTLSLIV